MNTITIDSNIYKGVEAYAKLHNVSIQSVIEKGLTLFLGKFVPAPSHENRSLDEALALMDTMMIKDGTPVPADEDAMSTLAEGKYKL